VLFLFPASRKDCLRLRIYVRPTVLQGAHAVEFAAAAGLARLTVMTSKWKPTTMAASQDLYSAEVDIVQHTRFCIDR